MPLLAQTRIKHAVPVWISVSVWEELGTDPAEIIAKLPPHFLIGLCSEMRMQARPTVAVRIAKPQTAPVCGLA
jgi:hypothetical protein